MAKLGAITSLHAFHMKVPMKFKVMAVVEGKLDSNGWVDGISAIEFKKALESITRDLEYKGVSTELSKVSVKFSGMESLAVYFIKRLGERYPVSYVQVWEGEDEFARVYSEEVK